MSETVLCTKITKSLLNHLQTEFRTQSTDHGCVIVTAFTHPDLASIEIFAETTTEGYLLSDEGETLNILFVSGLVIEDNKELLAQVRRIAEIHGVDFANSTLSIHATDDDLGQASQQLLSAIQAVSYLIYKRRQHSRTTFRDSVEELLLENRVIYTPNVVARGAANTHTIDFFINSDKNIFIESIAASSVITARNKAKDVAYKWLDLRRADPRPRFAVVVDDRERRWNTVWSDDEARSALTTYSDAVIRWTTERPQLIQLATEGLKRG